MRLVLNMTLRKDDSELVDDTSFRNRFFRFFDSKDGKLYQENRSEFRKVEIEDFDTLVDFSSKLKKTLETIDDIILINRRWLESKEEIKIPIENGYKIIEPLKEEEKYFVENLIKEQEQTKEKFLKFEEKLEERIGKIEREKVILEDNTKKEKTNSLF